jgi:hypothetical protein
VQEISDLRTTTLSLESLSEYDGAAFLAELGVRGTTQELARTTREYDGHALALRLLGEFLVRVHQGEVRCRDRVPLFKADKRLGRHAFRVMHAYEIWLGDAELDVLRLLGLFDRPASKAAMDALRGEPIRGVTDGLFKKKWFRKVPIAADDWDWTLGSLRKHGLVLLEDADAPGSVDAHPLVREYFADVLRERHQDGWRDANLRLYELLCRSAPDLPETVKEMEPLFAAVGHGCRAGRQQEAFSEVYRRRIQRRGEFYNWKKLGAFGLSLTALAGFFDRPWVQPSERLSDGDRAFVLNEAGFYLRALGRLGEAVQPSSSLRSIRR